MRYANLIITFLFRGKLQNRVRGMTLIELLIVLAIIGTLGGIAVPTYSNHTQDQKVSTAIVDIKLIEAWVTRFYAERGRPPDTLAETGLPAKLDPWGRPYQYTRLAGLAKNEQDAKCRWDKNEKPLNADFDLFSMGKDGASTPKITLGPSFDDVIRANGGRFVGLASEY
jgi:general secretion pathway protein G